MSNHILGILCSGRGSNMQSIMAAIESGQIKAEIGIVLTDKPEARALQVASEAGIKSVCVNRKACSTQQEFEEKLVAELKAANVTLVVLAGFMRILSPYFVEAYRHRILNIHPSLLPSFGGAHAHRDVLAYGTKVSGCTIHFVDEGMDHGPIILQDTVPVLDDDTEDTLAARVLTKEHILYPKAIELFVDGRLELIDDRHVRIKP
ncbi:MAG: phosphoribosylglycinamide formyltransferase [Veillonellaceae bacterium]|uniref:phosphoribosylglycinamide formyltransferase n=1 Tax=Anaerovibrio lipolyticus TaxID=82374 RepID=UPI001F3FD337|nr:phosphoribosylglycinamide formyltransferase [Anaerovibrio lipolyticus]MCI6910308.1 phosphoribosylglycinamide formyltransferase [Veillonellaceae bacterium]MDY5053129.1 phosphoribosylglycinamide formyltransferase [Anaerovibrio sp.]MCF2600173.1 phosphoribosylglycinamide formyltransferase [Anaerovibrio lipolyticus]MCI7079407.1 phosphoribosylglycinamide formyltransferase [Veillonellaceae bacterium]MCI7091752.1 phosphoribosylglycinamide formyltransferase [Veillonellaceae bacterium]